MSANPTDRPRPWHWQADRSMLLSGVCRMALAARRRTRPNNIPIEYIEINIVEAARGGTTNTSQQHTDRVHRDKYCRGSSWGNARN
jgi:hypothetical protein